MAAVAAAAFDGKPVGEALRLSARAWSRFVGAASPALSAAFVLLLLGAMLATLFLASFERGATLFLGGMLAASVLATVSQAANTRWALARRTSQLATLKSRFTAESAARSRAERALGPLRERARLFDEGLPIMVAYLGSDWRLRYHNRAYASWLGLDDARIDGRRVNEILAPDIMREAHPRLAEAFAGHDVHYERTQAGRGSARSRLFVQYFPRYRDDGDVDGIFVVLSEIAAGEDVAAAGADETRTDPATRLRCALERDEFSLHMQPIAPLDGCSASLPMGEVLLRLNEEEAKLLPPGGFIPVAEDLGMLHELDRWVVRHVVDRCEKDRARPALLLVNLWPQTILRGDFGRYVRELLASRGLAGEGLCFELAQRELLADRQAYLDFAEQLRGTACRLALCGFDGNAEALALAKSMGADFLKIDPGLVLGMLRDADSLARMRALAHAARDSGIGTIAECVENEPTRLALARLGVQFAQGFGVSRPRPMDPLRPQPDEADRPCARSIAPRCGSAESIPEQPGQP